MILCDLVLFRFAQLRVLFFDDLAGALDGLIEQIAQRHILARTRFHQLAIVAENAAKGDVAKIGRVTFAPRDLEDLLEMQSLRRADDDTKPCRPSNR